MTKQFGFNFSNLLRPMALPARRFSEQARLSANDLWRSGSAVVSGGVCYDLVITL